MKDNLDGKIKGGIKKEETPKNIELMVDNLLDNLEKRRGRNYKKAAMAASVAFLIVTGTGMGAIASNTENKNTNKIAKYSIEQSNGKKIITFKDEVVFGENNKFNADVNKLEKIEIETNKWGDEVLTLHGKGNYKDNSANFNKELDDKLKASFINGEEQFKMVSADAQKKAGKEEMLKNKNYVDVFKQSIDYMIVDEKGYLLDASSYSAGDNIFYSEHYINKDMKKVYITPIVNYSMGIKSKEIDVTIKDGKINVANSEDFTFTVEELEGKTKINYIGNTDYIVRLTLGQENEMEFTEEVDYNKDGEVNKKDYDTILYNCNDNNYKYEMRKPNEGFIIINDEIADGNYILEYADFDAVNLLKEETIEVDLKK